MISWKLGIPTQFYIYDIIKRISQNYAQEFGNMNVLLTCSDESSPLWQGICALPPEETRRWAVARGYAATSDGVQGINIVEPHFDFLPDEMTLYQCFKANVLGAYEGNFLPFCLSEMEQFVVVVDDRTYQSILSEMQQDANPLPDRIRVEIADI